MLAPINNLIRKLSGRPPLCDVCHKREAVCVLRENCIVGRLKIVNMCGECREKWQKERLAGNPGPISGEYHQTAPEAEEKS